MQSFVDIWQYMPHGMCLLWQPWLVALWAGSDLLIFLSYTAIPIALLTVLRKREDIPFSGLVVLFASFILLCGLTHLMGIVTLWYPIYPWVGLLKLATGLVSAATAVVLFRLIPVLVALPSPSQMADANSRLQAEADAHKVTLGKLERLVADLRAEAEAHQATLASLEDQVAERTEELHDANTKLAVQTREALHRSANLLSVVTSLAAETARGFERTEEFVDTLLGRIHSLAMATSTVMSGENHNSGDLATIMRQQLDPVLLTYGKRVQFDGPPTLVVSEAAQQISLAIHELATNAHKYSLSRDADVRLSITWGVEGNDDEQKFSLVWCETLPDGFPTVREPSAEGGFGTELLTRIVPQILRGKASRTLTEGKLEYRLEAPAATVLANPDDVETATLASRLVRKNFGSE